MSEELNTTRDDWAILPTKSIVEVAQEAERRIDAIIKIKQIALKVTNAGDWTNQQGKPYLQGSGAEKVASLFNISWRIDEPRIEFEDDGHFTYTYKGDFSLAGRSIQVDGSRSSKDPFFKKYDYSKDEAGKTIKTERPISAIDKRDVKMAAMTNLLGNGVTRILGIRNLTWEDLLKFAGIKQDEVAGISYKKEGEKLPPREPQKKKEGEKEELKLTVTIKDVTVKTGKGAKGDWKLFKITTNEDLILQAFDTKIGDLAIQEKGTNVPLNLEYQTKEFQGKDGVTVQGKEIVSLTLVEREPG